MLHSKFIPLLFALFFTDGNFLSTTVPAPEAHPFYVSVTEIDQNKKDNILEVSCRIFTDDFEKTLRMHYKVHVDLLNPKDASAMNKLVNDYVKKHVIITTDGKKAALQFVGYEQIEEAVQCYFQVNSAEVKKTVSVFNNLLFEYKPEQINIVHVTVNDTRKSRQLVNPEASVDFEF